MKVGFVYFIEAVGVNRIKIGYSSEDPRRGRLHALQTASPVALRLLGFIPGSHSTESGFHVRFFHIRTKGEWFEATEELRRFIDTLPDLFVPEEPKNSEARKRKHRSFEDRNKPEQFVVPPKGISRGRGRVPRYSGDPKDDPAIQGAIRLFRAMMS